MGGEGGDTREADEQRARTARKWPDGSQRRGPCRDVEASRRSETTRVKRLLGVSIFCVRRAGLEAGAFLFGALVGQIDFWTQNAYVGQMAILFLVVQAVPHDKVIGDFKAPVGDGQVYQAAARAV